jgi:hypothetical protein
VLRELNLLVRRQHGVVHRSQALAAGVTPRMIFQRLNSREWLLLAPNVYALASYPSTWKRQYKAAELSVAKGALGGYAAAKVHCWDGYKTAPPEVVSSTVAGTEARSRPSIEVAMCRPRPSMASA